MRSRQPPRRILGRPQAITLEPRPAPTLADMVGRVRVARGTAGRAACQAMATWERDGSPSSMLVICTRVGSAQFVPRGYLTANCDQCDHPVWLNPDVADAAERLAMPVVATCFHCLKPDGPGD
jgi:hypothetical protein